LDWSWSWQTSGSPSSNSSSNQTNHFGYHPNNPMASLLDSRYWPTHTPQSQINRDEIDFLLEGTFQRVLPLLNHSVVLPGGVANSRIIYDGVLNNEQSLPTTKGGGIQVMNRNARRPKKANKGARPCSRVSRRQKKEKIGKRKRR
jgi:hypothetical protein